MEFARDSVARSADFEKNVSSFLPKGELSMFRLKRAYEKPAPEDGIRVLIERYWPRDLSDKRAKIDLWLKDVAPSAELHRDFGASPAPPRWDSFQSLYRNELTNKRASIKLLREKGEAGTVTLVYNAHDKDHNAAVVLKQFLEEAH
jgi:uncharacterized protein YeaO (DUF488 family)